MARRRQLPKESPWKEGRGVDVHTEDSWPQSSQHKSLTLTYSSIYYHMWILLSIIVDEVEIQEGIPLYSAKEEKEKK